MAHSFFLLANALLAVSLVGMVAILTRYMSPWLKASGGFSWRKFPFSNFSFRWVLPKKTHHLLQATKERKSLLKKDYWDKLLK